MWVNKIMHRKHRSDAWNSDFDICQKLSWRCQNLSWRCQKTCNSVPKVPGVFPSLLLIPIWFEKLLIPNKIIIQNKSKHNRFRWSPNSNLVEILWNIYIFRLVHSFGKCARKTNENYTNSQMPRVILVSSMLLLRGTVNLNVVGAQTQINSGSSVPQVNDLNDQLHDIYNIYMQSFCLICGLNSVHQLKLPFKTWS